MARIFALALTAFFLCPFLARGEPFSGQLPANEPFASSQLKSFPANCQGPSIPDINGWKTGRKSRIEFRLSNETVAYLGSDIEYLNPFNPGEVLRVVSRHVPGVFFAKKSTNDRLFREVVTSLYSAKDREEFFKTVDKKIDPILYAHWRTVKNPRTGEEMLAGDVDIWFLKSDGECLVAKNEKIKTQFLSENVGNGKPRNILSGAKYQIGDAYHILEVDPRILKPLAEKER